MPTARRKAPVSPAPVLLDGLGVVGLGGLEPVIVGALISGDPLLLIGAHGTGKSYLLARIADALELEWRHYNASLLNFDDLVGYPLPGVDGTLRYIQTPASVWGAEAVFIDEISRCRPDLQNKLFPIIHERKVQGLALDRLRYRWSAMNPPAGDDEDEHGYLGSEPLDPALADRFAFIVEMPGWASLSEAQQEALVLGSGAPVCRIAAGKLRAAIARGREFLPILRAEHAASLAGYIRLVIGFLDQSGISFSPRRAAVLLPNILAVHAARLVHDGRADPAGSAYLALAHAFPQAATGQKVDRVKVLAAHREAWKVAGFVAGAPLRLLHGERDPARRALLAVSLDGLSRQECSTVVADALATLPAGGRHALAAALFESDGAGKLVAAVAEQTAQLYALAATPQAVHESVASGSTRFHTWRALKALLAREPARSTETLLLTNLLLGLFGAAELETEADLRQAVASWRDVRAKVKEVAA